MALIRAVTEETASGEYKAKVGIEWDGIDWLLIRTIDDHGFPFHENSTPLGAYMPVTATIRSDDEPDQFREQLRTLAEDCINQGGITHLQAI